MRGGEKAAQSISLQESVNHNCCAPSAGGLSIVPGSIVEREFAGAGADHKQEPPSDSDVAGEEVEIGLPRNRIGDVPVIVDHEGGDDRYEEQSGGSCPRVKPEEERGAAQDIDDKSGEQSERGVWNPLRRQKSDHPAPIARVAVGQNQEQPREDPATQQRRNRFPFRHAPRPGNDLPSKNVPI